MANNSTTKTLTAACGFMSSVEAICTTKCTNVAEIILSNQTWYANTLEVINLDQAASTGLNIDLSEIPANAVIDSVHFSRRIDMTGQSMFFTSWVTFPQVSSSSGSVDERIRAFLSETPRPAQFNVTLHLSGVLGREYESTSKYKLEKGKNYSSHAYLNGANLSLEVEYHVAEDDSTVSYGTNNTWQKCNVYYGTGGSWQKCKAYFGTGGSWQECK